VKVLVVGGGGREHALAWKMAQSPQVERVFVAPGNAGTAREPKTKNIAIGAEDISDLLDFAKANAIDLTVVGPEAPLVAGIVDAFKAAGLKIFGPTKKAAQLEGSKRFAKDFTTRHHIPTAAYATFTDAEEATAYIRSQGAPIVVKADGLAAGKGVILALTEDRAIGAVYDMLEGQTFGKAGKRVVIEEFLTGEEASFICMVNGEDVLPLATSQDHKALGNGDTGPNTGGMGAYSPAPVVTPDIHHRIMREVIEPTIAGMVAEGNPYTGFLYAGLMIAADGTPRVLEFNCRLGDPEAQSILLRLRTDLTELCLNALDGRLATTSVQWDPRAALGVVMAAGGYPGAYKKGDVIHDLPAHEAADIKVFHAGTAEHDREIITSGGRVLCVTALGQTIRDAQAHAYELVRAIDWDGVYFRKDIGYRAVNGKGISHRDRH
jgi:phosphoribosylamine---glycine ligase